MMSLFWVISPLFTAHAKHPLPDVQQGNSALKSLEITGAHKQSCSLSNIWVVIVTEQLLHLRVEKSLHLLWRFLTLHTIFNLWGNAFRMLLGLRALFPCCTSGKRCFA